MGNILEELKSILLKNNDYSVTACEIWVCLNSFSFHRIKSEIPKKFTCASSAYSVRQSGAEREERTAPLLVAQFNAKITFQTPSHNK